MLFRPHGMKDARDPQRGAGSRRCERSVRLRFPAEEAFDSVALIP